MLYRRSLDGILLRGIAKHETHEAIIEEYSGICRATDQGQSLHVVVEVGILLAYHDPKTASSSQKCLKCANITKSS